MEDEEGVVDFEKLIFKFKQSWKSLSIQENYRQARLSPCLTISSEIVTSNYQHKSFESGNLTLTTSVTTIKELADRGSYRWIKNKRKCT